MAIPVIGMHYLFLSNSHELSTPEKISDNIIKHGGIYYPTLSENAIPEIKKILYSIKKPDVVVLGSSRMLQFRESFFDHSFYSLGNLAKDIYRVRDVIKEYLLANPPEVLILGLDFWWFRSPEDTGNNVIVDKKGMFAERPGNDANQEQAWIDKLMMPTRWIMESRISLSDYFKVVFGGTPTPYPGYGVGAISGNGGFAPDGSFYYLGTIHYTVPVQQGFSVAIEQIRANYPGPFEHGKSISQESLQVLDEIELLAKMHDIRLVMLLPPVADSVLEEMNRFSDAYSYVNDLREYLKTRNSKVYDFHDAQMLDADDCEFIDGIHGGDVVSARMLLSLSRDHEQWLASYINIEDLEEKVKKYSGVALMSRKYSPLEFKEPDFLRIGCNKI